MSEMLESLFPEINQELLDKFYQFIEVLIILKVEIIECKRNLEILSIIVTFRLKKVLKANYKVLSKREKNLLNSKLLQNLDFKYDFNKI